MSNRFYNHINTMFRYSIVYKDRALKINIFKKLGVSVCVLLMKKTVIIEWIIKKTCLKLVLLIHSAFLFLSFLEGRENEIE